jgi:alpha-galactosidase
MSLILNSEFMAFYLRPAEGRWDLAARPAPWPFIEKASMSVVWRANGTKRRWDGDISGAHLMDAQTVDSIHGPLKRCSVVLETGMRDLSLYLEFTLALQMPLFLWRIHVTNESSNPVHLDRLEMMRVGTPRVRSQSNRLLASFPRLQSSAIPDAGSLRVHPTPGELAFYTNGWQSWTYAGSLGKADRFPQTRLGPFTRPMHMNAGTSMPRRRKVYTSDMFGVIGDRQSRTGVLAGFLSQRSAFGRLDVRLEKFAPYLCLLVSGDDARLEPGERFTSDWACLQFVKLDTEDPLEPYLEAVASENGARRARSVPVGWCSWYYFFQSIEEKDVLANLRWAKQKKAQIPLEVIQIDDGFEAEVGDWLDVDVAAFPKGMASLATEIREAGFQPGLWLAPFIAKPSSKVVREHPDWVLRRAGGIPANAGFAWNSFGRALDVTHPEVLENLRQLMDTVTRQWGYTYLKLDFLYAGALPGRHYDPRLTRAQALYQALNVIRTAVGDDITLVGCGCPLGSGIGIFDSMRISPDIAPHWRPRYHGISLPLRGEPGLPSMRNAVVSALSRAPLHRRWWVNDPDCLMLRDTETRLTEAEVQTLATVIALSAGALMISDHLPALSETRENWLARLLPPLPEAARVVDWFDRAYPSKLVLSLDGAAGDWHLIALLNWQDHEAQVEIDLEKLGVPISSSYHTLDFWRGVYQRFSHPRLCLPSVPSHGVALLALRSAIEAPQWIGDSLHISQGLGVKDFQTKEAGVSVQLDLGRHAQGRAWLSLPAMPQLATLDNQPVEWRRETEEVYAFDLDFMGEARLAIDWGSGHS